MKANFVKLLDFINGVIDFGALASAKNLSKMLGQDGYPHVSDVRERDLRGPSDLGMTSHEVQKSVHHFMKSF